MDQVQLVEQVAEIPEVRLVGADVLGGENSVEDDAQLFVGAGEGRTVDVRQDDQLVVLLEIGQRPGAVGKGRPVPDRGAEGLGVGVRHRDPEFGGHATQGLGQDLRVEHGRILLLHPMFIAVEDIDQGLRRGVKAARLGPVAERRPDSPFPVDERAVAVESKGGEVAELHDASAMMGGWSFSRGRDTSVAQRGSHVAVACSA